MKLLELIDGAMELFERDDTFRSFHSIPAFGYGTYMLREGKTEEDFIKPVKVSMLTAFQVMENESLKVEIHGDGRKGVRTQRENGEREKECRQRENR